MEGTGCACAHFQQARWSVQLLVARGGAGQSSRKFCFSKCLLISTISGGGEPNPRLQEWTVYRRETLSNPGWPLFPCSGIYLLHAGIIRLSISHSEIWIIWGSGEHSCPAGVVWWGSCSQTSMVSYKYKYSYLYRVALLRKYIPTNAPNASSWCVCRQQFSPAKYTLMLVREHDDHISEITFASLGQGL